MAQKPNSELNSRERRAAARAAAGISAPQGTEESTQNYGSVVEAARVREVIEKVVEDEFKLVLESLKTQGVGSNRTLEIVIDYAEGTESLSLDTVAEVSQAISVALDAADDGDAPYSLEVSSPGASRPLTELRHWKRSIGRLIDITPADAGENYLARLQDVTEQGPVLARKKNTKKGQKESYQEAETISWDLISLAKVEVEFNH